MCHFVLCHFVLLIEQIAELSNRPVQENMQFTNDVNLSVDQDQIAFINELSKLGTISRVIPIN